MSRNVHIKLRNDDLKEDVEISEDNQSLHSKATHFISRSMQTETNDLQLLVSELREFIDDFFFFVKNDALLETCDGDVDATLLPLLLFRCFE